MPGISGKALYQKLQADFPGMKVLYMSGYTDNVIGDKGLLKEGVDFIGKPFTINELSMKVYDILNPWKAAHVENTDH